MVRYDVTIIGGGIVGLATALALTRRAPAKRIAVLEKEPKLATHQTGRNSGVIHSGIYYRPGSLKASLCLQGARRMIEFCRRHGIPVERCGKVIVATSAEEIPRLEELYRRGLANGVPGLTLIGPERLKEIEPHANGMAALHVASTAIVDFGKVAAALAEEIESQGGRIHLSTQVKRIDRRSEAAGRSEGFHLETSQGGITSRFLINCAGLHSDRLARMAGASISSQIIPFRGEYYELVPERRHLVKNLIYPVPDPSLPFLGVHLSRRIDGRVEAGPNAVLALKREGYRRWDLNLEDLWELLRFPGFWRMSARYWRSGVQEMIRSYEKRAFVQAVQRLVPQITDSDLIPSLTGVRAQAVGSNGSLLDDFHLIQEPGILHVVNAPSPAATASLAIGEAIADAAFKTA